MNEQEWLVCTHPWLMFEAVNEVATDRKFRLFACACYRLNWPSVTDALARSAVLLAEQYADGVISWETLNQAKRSSHPACWHLTCKSGKAAAWDVVDDAYLEFVDDKDACQKLTPLASLFREVFRNPFRPVAVDPAWRVWNSGMVVKLARGIYDDRAFDRLSVLADALEDAGCDHADILQHCRTETLHVRGCWLVDLILQKS
jgi:hypothetical protein